MHVCNYPGLVVKRGDSTFIYLKGKDVIYSPSVSSDLENGEGVIVDFTLDYGKPENADSGKIKGFLIAEITKITPIPGNPLLNTLTDTVKTLPAERILSTIQQQNAFILNRFFLFSEHRGDTLPLRFQLSYDPLQVAADKVYDLFLRVSYRTDQPSANQATTQYNTFDLSELSRKETDSLFFRIFYVKAINRDSTQLTWATSPVYRFGLK
jgi:hypothetical protein